MNKLMTCMHWTLPPLLAREVISAEVLVVAGKAEVDLRPVNGATMLAWAGLALLMLATVAVESIEVAISNSPFLLTSRLLLFNLLLEWSSNSSPSSFYNAFWLLFALSFWECHFWSNGSGFIFRSLAVGSYDGHIQETLALSLGTTHGVPRVLMSIILSHLIWVRNAFYGPSFFWG